MTLYFDSTLGDIPGVIDEISFSRSHPFIAVKSFSNSTGQGVISIFNSDSELVDTEVKSFAANQLSWHPSKPLLAVSWVNGHITIWNGDTKERNEETELGRASDQGNLSKLLSSLFYIFQLTI